MHFTPGSLVLLHKKTSYGLLGKGKQYIRRRPGKETRLFYPSAARWRKKLEAGSKRSGSRKMQRKRQKRTSFITARIFPFLSLVNGGAGAGKSLAEMLL